MWEGCKEQRIGEEERINNMYKTRTSIEGMSIDKIKSLDLKVLTVLTSEQTIYNC